VSTTEGLFGVELVVWPAHHLPVRSDEVRHVVRRKVVSQQKERRQVDCSSLDVIEQTRGAFDQLLRCDERPRSRSSPTAQTKVMQRRAGCSKVEPPFLDLDEVNEQTTEQPSRLEAHRRKTGALHPRGSRASCLASTPAIPVLLTSLADARSRAFCFTRPFGRAAPSCRKHPAGRRRAPARACVPNTVRSRDEATTSKTSARSGSSTCEAESKAWMGGPLARRTMWRVHRSETRMSCSSRWQARSVRRRPRHRRHCRSWV
jgi:hypothetical protein